MIAPRKRPAAPKRRTTAKSAKSTKSAKAPKRAARPAAATSSGSAENPNLLNAGAARRDISPPNPKLLRPTGMSRLQSTIGVLDPLYIEALAVEAGGRGAILLTGDLRTLEYDWVVEVRTTVAERLDLEPEQILFSSTHNHCSSPEPDGDSPEAQAALVVANRLITSAMIDAAIEAWETRRPAEIAYTQATLADRVGENRRMRVSNGTCINCWHGGAVCPPGHKYVAPGGPDSTEVRVLSVRQVGAKKPFAVFVSYPSHPHLSALPYFSGESVGQAKREIAADLGGDVIVLWGNHTGGDIDMHCVHPKPDGLEAELAWFQQSQQTLGRRLAAAVVPAVRGCRRYERPATLKHGYRSTGEGRPKESSIVMINAVVLGDVALASIPGEIFLELGREAMARSPVPKLLMMGYNGSAAGYQPKPLGFEQGSYEVMRGPAKSDDDLLEARPGLFVRRAQRDTGQKVVDTLVAMLGELTA
jgi:hypothetical protein